MDWNRHSQRGFVRSKRMKLLAILGSAAAIAGMWPLTNTLNPTTFLQKAFLDQTVEVSDTDPAMIKAFAQGRATLPQFIETMKHPPFGGLSDFAVKVGVTASHTTEYIWLLSPQISDTAVTGVVANPPESASQIIKGQTVTYPRSRVVDWTYNDLNEMRGNFTACALLTHAPTQEREQFQTAYKLDCWAIR